MRNIFSHAALVFSFFLSISVSHSQQGAIAGIVQGLDGPLHGAIISVGNIMVFTGKQGEFSIALRPGDYALHITYTGYKKIIQEIKLKAAQSISLNFIMIPHEVMDEIVVTGSRSSIQRSSLTTPVPADVISPVQLLQTAQLSLTQMLQFTVPSFNASRQLVNEPITLRGLDPDQVLILVNGKRYHNMSFVNWGGVRGILGRSAVSNDLNSIPFPAIEKIEILRDGASAQYGSDAIAGVINIELKKSIGKTWIQMQTGEFYKGDGENINIGINHGFSFLRKGFANVSAAWRFQNPVYRGGEYKGTVYSNNTSIDDSIVQARNFNRNHVSNAGSSKHNSIGVALNGGYALGRQTELFWTAAADHRSTIFISGYILPKNISRLNPELFPDGVKPKPENQSSNISGIAGIRGKTKSRWNWEFSSAYGSNTGKYYNEHTNNASQYFTLGKTAPTSFYTGSLIYGQLTNCFQLSKQFTAKTGKMLNMGFGVEWRLEHFQIKEGEEASWKNYDSSGRKQGGSGGLVFSPFDAAKESRNVTAMYIDIESEIKYRLLACLAGRYEHYSDFGGNLAGKLALRYKVKEYLFVRGSVSNGFRAPGLQQRFYSFTRAGFSTNGGVYLPITLGVFRNNSEVAMALGMPLLRAEKSLNISGGFAIRIHHRIRMTVDAYWIQIRNRIVLSDIFDRTTNSNVDDLLRNLTNVNQVQVFANAINTRTKGVDMVLNGNWGLRKANLVVMLGANFTQTHLFGEIKNAGNLKGDSLNTNTLFGRQERGKLEKGQPAHKIILSFQYKIGKIGLLLRNTRFGRTAILSDDTRMNADERFSSKILTDINLDYLLKNWLTVTAGVNNIFDVYPDRLKDYRNTGEGVHLYGQEATPFGFNGGYYFVKVIFNL